MADRIIIYISGETEDDVQEQMRQAQQLCTDRSDEVVSVARETPRRADAWEDAHRMIRDGDADRIVVATGAAVPDLLESATGGIPGRGGRHRDATQRRTRPVRRDEGPGRTARQDAEA